jgi:hypothetical protein
MFKKHDTARPSRARFFLPLPAAVCLAVLLLQAFPSSAQKPKLVLKEKKIPVVFYNTENFYDTLDDPHKNDNEFLPSSALHWDSEKYHEKVHNIAKVLSSADPFELPGVIGLAEVENEAVVKDLAGDRALKAAKYRIILPEGNDPRGIDVALLYRPSKFRLLGEKPFPSSAEDRSRFVLYAKLLSPAGDTLHFIVNHWKSRAGASLEETAAKRMENALVARHITDSLLRVNPKSKILLMGDFNDNPTDASITGGLRALPPAAPYLPGNLYNLMYPKYVAGEGTLYYKGWDMFDQLIASGSFLGRQRKGGTGINPATGYVLMHDWMLFENKEGVMVPERMSTGKKYFGGYSDHLPVYVILRYFVFE